MSGKLGDGPADSVWKKTELFHTDSVFCGLSAKGYPRGRGGCVSTGPSAALNLRIREMQ